MSAVLLTEAFWSKVSTSGECWEWRGMRLISGYGLLHRPRVNPGSRLAHRIAWELHYGPVPAGKYVLHHCDNPPCVRPSHLFVGTAGDNAKDKAAKGRAPSGPNHHLIRHPEWRAVGEHIAQSKLTDSAVITIRERVAHGEMQKALADEFGVSKATICCLVKRKTWRHI